VFDRPDADVPLDVHLGAEDLLGPVRGGGGRGGARLRARPGRLGRRWGLGDGGGHADQQGGGRPEADSDSRHVETLLRQDRASRPGGPSAGRPNERPPGVEQLPRPPGPPQNPVVVGNVLNTPGAVVGVVSVTSGGNPVVNRPGAVVGVVSVTSGGTPVVVNRPAAVVAPPRVTPVVAAVPNVTGAVA